MIDAEFQSPQGNSAATLDSGAQPQILVQFIMKGEDYADATMVDPLF